MNHRSLVLETMHHKILEGHPQLSPSSKKRNITYTKNNRDLSLQKGILHFKRAIFQS
jgi:hypothetical protein